MKLSVSAWCLQSKLFKKEMDIFDFILYINNNNVKNVELLDCFLDNNLDKINLLLKNLNMSVSSYSIGNDFVQLSSKLREDELTAVYKGIDTAVAFNTKLLRVFSGNVKDNISYETGREWILEYLGRAAEYAAKREITMVLENHGFFAGKSNQVKEIIETIHSPYLKATADVGNFMLVEESPLSAVKNLDAHIGYVHFKDFKDVGESDSVYSSISGKHFQGTILGRGDVPLAEIVNCLAAQKYDGYLSIEYEGVEDPVYGTSESIKFAKSIIK